MHIYSFLVRLSLPSALAALALPCVYFRPPAARPAPWSLTARRAAPCWVLQVVVGRVGDQLLTSETGEVTRWALAPRACCL